MLPKLTRTQTDLINKMYPKDTMLLYDTESNRVYYLNDDIVKPTHHRISFATFKKLQSNNLIEQRMGMGPFTVWRLTTETKKLLQKLNKS